MQGKPLSILLIEDNHSDAKLIEKQLSGKKSYQFGLAHAVNLEDGLALIAKNEFEAIILDLSLPDSEGVATFDQIKAHAPGVPILVLTGHDDDEMAFDSLEKGAQDYIVKGPRVYSGLSRILRYSIEKHRLDALAKETEALLRIKELAGAIAHEFSQPIQILSLSLHMIEEEVGKTKYMERSHNMVARISELVNHLRNVTTLEQKEYLTEEIMNLTASAEESSE